MPRPSIAPTLSEADRRNILTLAEDLEQTARFVRDSLVDEHTESYRQLDTAIDHLGEAIRALRAGE